MGSRQSSKRLCRDEEKQAAENDMERKEESSKEGKGRGGGGLVSEVVERGKAPRPAFRLHQRLSIQRFKLSFAQNQGGE